MVFGCTVLSRGRENTILSCGTRQGGIPKDKDMVKATEWVIYDNSLPNVDYGITMGLVMHSFARGCWLSGLFTQGEY